MHDPGAILCAGIIRAAPSWKCGVKAEAVGIRIVLLPILSQSSPNHPPATVSIIRWRLVMISWAVSVRCVINMCLEITGRQEGRGFGNEHSR
jgi:hypothetical protein